MLYELEPEEPFEALASDEAFERSMKMASLALLRAIERARGFYPVQSPSEPKRKIERPIPEEMLGKGIVRAVAAAYEIPYAKMTGKDRARRFIGARAVAIRLLREQQWIDGTPRFSTPQIGRMLGGRDHSTIIHSLHNFDIYSERYPLVREVYDALRDDGE